MLKSRVAIWMATKPENEWISDRDIESLMVAPVGVWLIWRNHCQYTIYTCIPDPQDAFHCAHIWRLVHRSFHRLNVSSSCMSNPRNCYCHSSHATLSLYGVAMVSLPKYCSHSKLNPALQLAGACVALLQVVQRSLATKNRGKCLLFLYLVDASKRIF